MINNKIQIGLIKQLNKELESSHIYLIMASWVETKGFNGICSFLYDHSNEERMHMLKLIKYINSRGGHAEIDNIFIKKNKYKSLNELFQELFNHEKFISQEIFKLLDLSIKEKDYFTNNFLQWYIEEQIEEEKLFKTILDQINLIGNDKLGLYLFDQNIKKLSRKKY